MLAVVWDTVLSDVAQLGGAYLLALPIGWDREKGERTAGLRTFPIVAVAACGFMMLAELPDATADSRSRMLQGLIAGIGFIGGGAILRDRGSAAVTGTATAASIWNIGIVGAAVGMGFYPVAIILSLINLLTLKVLTPLKHHIEREPEENNQ